MRKRSMGLGRFALTLSAQHHVRNAQKEKQNPSVRYRASPLYSPVHTTAMLGLAACQKVRVTRNSFTTSS